MCKRSTSLLSFRFLMTSATTFEASLIWSSSNSSPSVSFIPNVPWPRILALDSLITLKYIESYHLFQSSKCKCIKPFMGTKAKVMDGGIPVVCLFMSIPLFIEYFVKCWNWLENMNDAKFLYFIGNCAMLLPTSQDISSSRPHHLPHQCWLLHREWVSHPSKPLDFQI